MNVLVSLLSGGIGDVFTFGDMYRTCHGLILFLALIGVSRTDECDGWIVVKLLCDCRHIGFYIAKMQGWLGTLILSIKVSIYMFWLCMKLGVGFRPSILHSFLQS